MPVAEEVDTVEEQTKDDGHVPLSLYGAILLEQGTYEGVCEVGGGELDAAKRR